ncbi:MAG: alanine racemase, partial [Actinomycetota bacterium]|nr:alanine racemase [Actinomycetota bacterium]
MTVSLSRARAQVNLSAIARNYRRLTACGVPVMGVVKADAYGHGAVEVARALRADGADWLGVALLSEAVQL